MKFTLIITYSAAVVVLAAIGSCSKPVSGCTNPAAVNYVLGATDSTTCVFDGMAMFYFDLNAPHAIVTMYGVSDSITTGYQGGAPGCGATGCATFTLPIGSYAYSASSSEGSWSGSVTINDTICIITLLKQQDGAVTFWSSDPNVLPISVSLTAQAGGGNTVTDSITIAYSKTQSCGSSGCANFTLSPGKYNYSATNGHFSQNGTVTIVADSCAGVIEL